MRSFPLGRLVTLASLVCLLIVTGSLLPIHGIFARFDSVLFQPAPSAPVLQPRLRRLVQCGQQQADGSEFLPRPKSPSMAFFWWKPKRGANFGDYLNVVIMGNITLGQLKEVTTKPEASQMLVIGSVMGFLSDDMIVWGTGVRTAQSIASRRKLVSKADVRAVRGPWSRNMLREYFPHIAVPDVYGDPALLLPLLPGPWRDQSNHGQDSQRRQVLVIGHISNEKEMSQEVNDARPLFPDLQLVYISPTKPWDFVVEQVRASALVISSSLHGIIVSDAFHVPARLVASPDEPLFKYYDYYQGTGRCLPDKADNVTHAIEMGGETQISPARLWEIQQGLLNSFPREYFDNPDALALCTQQ